MKLLLQILWGWSVLANGAVGIQVGTIQTNNQNIKIMKMNFTSPVWLQSASNVGGKEYISFKNEDANPKIQISCVGNVDIVSTYNGEQISQSITDATESTVTIQADQQTDIYLYGAVTYFKGSIGTPGKTIVIDCTHAKSLEKLDCSGNKLTSLDLSANKLLTELNCNWNSLTSLDLSANKLLTILDCQHNNLTDLDLSNNTLLTKVVCGYNQFTDLNLSQNKDLSTINCGNSRLTEIDLSSCAHLTYVDFSKSKLVSFDISNNTDVTQALCNNNEIITLDLRNNTNLTYLQTQGNSIIQTIYCVATNSSVADMIALTISQATSADGIVTLRQGDEFNQTIIDAAMNKGWDVQYYQ